YWRSDPADVSLNTICQMAGVSKPALYRQFGNEDGLMRAVLDRYAAQVLSDIFDVVERNAPMQDVLAALIRFASEDPKMETGCVFFKMRAGKHRLGPKTRDLVDHLDAAAVAAFETYLTGRRSAGDWRGDPAAPLAARYLVEQVGLALMQRAGGARPEAVRDTISLALSVIAPP
ncbi:MAG: TetR/AcrR family transcriptional regulator, partial [Pseudomonadota bacterium]